MESDGQRANWIKMRFEIMKTGKVKLCASLCMCLGIFTWIGNIKLDFWSLYVQQATEQSEASEVLFSLAHSQRQAPVSTGLRDDKSFNISSPIAQPDNVIEHRVFWSAWLDSLSTTVFDEQYERDWREQVRDARVVSLEAGCGRPTNRLATFADGTRACVRYGIDADQVLGETLSYYLATLLGISNLPPLALSKLNMPGDQWASVRKNIDALEWSPNAIVSLTKFIPNVTGVFLPLPLRKQQGLQLSPETISNMTIPNLVELMQWTDLILFDYLTANFDRIVSHIFSLQWDARVMERATNNLLKTINGDLVFIDNEAGLIHGYRVLDLWERYHRILLSSSCIFRRSTARRIAEMKRSGNAAKLLFELYRTREPFARELGSLSEEHALTLQSRIDVVHKHIEQCTEIT